MYLGRRRPPRFVFAESHLHFVRLSLSTYPSSPPYSQHHHVGEVPQEEAQHSRYTRRSDEDAARETAPGHTAGRTRWVQETEGTMEEVMRLVDAPASILGTAKKLVSIVSPVLLHGS